MPHFKERKEKNCLNCQATVQGRYCHVCGQENIEPKESFWYLVMHFVYDQIHLDGKLFNTLRYLLFNPGFLSHEYLKGRRAAYLHPIRMYVITSAFFFLIFFSIGSDDTEIVQLDETSVTVAELIGDLEEKRKSTLKKIQKTDQDSIKLTSFIRIGLDSALVLIDSDLARIRRDTTAKDSLKSFKKNEVSFLGGLSGMKYKRVQAYDSAQAALPESERDNFIKRKLTRQNLHLNEKYKADGEAMRKAIIDKFNHLFPQMLFVSLPLFALILQLLYVRRKGFYYVNHVIFTIHLYCGTFILILAGMVISGIFKFFHLDIPGWVTFIFWLIGLFYWYKNIRKFYEQGRAKSVLKYGLIMFFSMIMFILIFAAFFTFSAMTI